MKEELKKIFADIMEYQMNHFEIARGTEQYKLADKGLRLLDECEVNKLNKADVIKSVCEKCRFKAECRYKVLNNIGHDRRYFIDEQTVL